MISGKTYAYGKHAVLEALRATPKAIEKVFIESASDDSDIKALAEKAGIQISHKLPNDLEDAVHQGVVASIILPKLLKPYKEFAEELKVTADTSLVLLGELQDPQNVGAVIRSAAAFGISGVLVPEHNQVQITGSVVKVSAGMAFRIPLVTVPNVNNAIRDLKERGFWIYGLEGEGKNPLPKEKFDAPAVFIIGGEAKGIREKTKELCDIILSIPINPQCESLNAAASAAAVLYAWSVQHPKSLK